MVRRRRRKISRETKVELEKLELFRSNRSWEKRLARATLLRKAILLGAEGQGQRDDLARRLGVARGSVRRLLKQAQTLGAEGVVRLELLALDKLSELDFLGRFLREAVRSLDFLDLSQREQFETYLQVSPRWAELKPHEFATASRSFGLRYRQLTFARHEFRTIPPQHLANFLAIYANFLLQPEKYRVVWLDESSVAPSNFKRQGWRQRGKPLLRRTRIAYERILLLGAMDASGLLALQFFVRGFGGQAFFSFVAQLVERLSEDVEDRRPVIFFVDNATTHRTAELLRFCERHSVLLFFNLPQKSMFNPIEFCWGFVKRDFRRLTDHSG